MRFMGLRTIPYYFGYFLSDYIFYMIPNIIFIVVSNCTFLEIFTDYQVIKISGIISFGLVIVPLNYIICLSF